jgi:hypothetical protein
MDQSEALAALAAKEKAQEQLAKAANCPPWRHAAFGLLMAGIVASPAFSFAIRTAILIAVLAAIAILVQSDRKRTGMFINGYRRGRTRMVASGLLIVVLLLYGISTYYGLALGDSLTPLLLGLAAFLIATVASVIWQRVFVREMCA